MRTDAGPPISDLTGFLAHDVRTSLRFAQLNLTNLEEAVQSGNETSLRRYIEALRARLEGADHLLYRLREYGKALDPVAMAESVEVSNLAAEFERFTLACNFEPRFSGPSTTLTTSRHHLRLILRELVENAVRHHDQEKGAVAINWHLSRTSVLFAVADDGPGIPPEFHQRVFDLGRTLQAKDSRRNAGIGLAIVSRLLSAIGAPFGILSEPRRRRGTLVYFRWPLTVPCELISPHGAGGLEA